MEGEEGVKGRVSASRGESGHAENEEGGLGEAGSRCSINQKE